MPKKSWDELNPKKKRKKKKERARMAKQSNLAGDPIRKNK